MTNPPDYQQIAALALAKCAAYDPWFPKASRAIVESWAEQLTPHRFELADVLAGVAKMYSDNGSGFRPLPKDLVDATRAVRRDRTERESTAERQARENRRDAELEAAEAAAGRRRMAAMIGQPSAGRSLSRAF